MSLSSTNVTASVAKLVVIYSRIGGHATHSKGVGRLSMQDSGRKQNSDFTATAGARDRLVLCRHGPNTQNECSSVFNYAHRVSVYHA